MERKHKELKLLSRERSETRWLNTASLVILAAVALAFTLVYTRKVLIPFVMAIFIVSMVSPILDFLVIRFRFPRVMAVLASLSVALAIVFVIGLLFADAVNTIVTDPNSPVSKVSELKLSELELDTEAVTPLDSPMYEVLDWMEKRDIYTFSELQVKRVITWWRNLVRELSRPLFLLLGDAVGLVVRIITSSFFITIFTVFLLAGRNPRLLRQGVAADVDSKIRRYILTKVAISAVTGFAVWFSLDAIGLNLASVFGLLAFLLNFIPSIGSIISTFLPVPLALTQFGLFSMSSVLVFLIPGSIQMLMGNVLEPKLMGEGLNLHPVTIILALAFWGLLWGVVGMFLAAPMTAVIRIVFMQFDMLRPMGELMAGKLPESLQRAS